jgi:hypothetical protein
VDVCDLCLLPRCGRAFTLASVTRSVCMALAAPPWLLSPVAQRCIRGRRATEQCGGQRGDTCRASRDGLWLSLHQTLLARGNSKDEVLGRTQQQEIVCRWTG